MLEPVPRPSTGQPNGATSLRTVLLVSPQFPPSTLVGAHRARHLAKHLGAHGWRPVVLTVRPDEDEDLDTRLAELVPPDIEIVRVSGVPKGVARRLGIGDVGLRSYASLRRAVLRWIETQRPHLVFITGFPFYPMLIAATVRRRGVPVVLDFQDPWISAWGAAQPRTSKAGLAHRLALKLEPRAVRAASGIISVSAEQNRQMRLRYPDMAIERFCDLPIGGDWDDYEAAVTPLPDKEDVFLYAGTLLPRSGDVLVAFFRAVRAMRASEPRRFARARFRFVGTAAVTDRRAGPVVMPIAEAHGIADLVEEISWRVPFLDALGMMRQARANLMIGSDEPHYTASKIYPALMSGRPFLSIFHEKSSAHEILARCGGGIALSFGEHDDLAVLEPAMQSALARMLDRDVELGTPDRRAIEPFTAHEIARQCATFFDKVLQLHRRDSGAHEGGPATSPRTAKRP